MLSQYPEYVLGLKGQFMCRHHHQALYPIGTPLDLMFVQYMQNGDGISSRLAGPCLRDGQHILTLQDGGYGSELDIGGPFKTQFGYTGFDTVCNGIRFKLHSIGICRKGLNIPDKLQIFPFYVVGKASPGGMWNI